MCSGAHSSFPPLTLPVLTVNKHSLHLQLIELIKGFDITFQPQRTLSCKWKTWKTKTPPSERSSLLRTPRRTSISEEPNMAAFISAKPEMSYPQKLQSTRLYRQSTVCEFLSLQRSKWKVIYFVECSEYLLHFKGFRFPFHSG